jgi:hypothetical protein
MKCFSIVIILMSFNITSAYSQNFYKDLVIPKNGVQVSGGPAFIYANNSGGLRTLGFKLLPSVSIAYTHQINPYLSMRATTGVQWLQSNVQLKDEAKERWGQQDKAFGFRGQAFYADLMPMLQLFPARHQGSTINFYAGAGIGMLYVNSTQFRMVNLQTVEKKENIFTGYIPIRGAIGKKLNETVELLLEGTFMATFSDQLDGNVGKKYIQNDHLLQGNLGVKKFF